MKHALVILSIVYEEAVERTLTKDPDVKISSFIDAAKHVLDKHKLADNLWWPLTAMYHWHNDTVEWIEELGDRFSLERGSQLVDATADVVEACDWVERAVNDKSLVLVRHTKGKKVVCVQGGRRIT